MTLCTLDSTFNYEYIIIERHLQTGDAFSVVRQIIYWAFCMQMALNQHGFDNNYHTSILDVVVTQT